jgi:glycine cleavage system aminomethyltransferase T
VTPARLGHGLGCPRAETQRQLAVDVHQLNDVAVIAAAGPSAQEVVKTMGLMDKVKAQATVLAQKTQDTIDQVQARRRADDLLCELGGLVYADRTGRGNADTHAQVDKLIADIKAHEAENGISVTPDSGGQPSNQPGPDAADQTFPPETGTTQV